MPAWPPRASAGPPFWTIQLAAEEFGKPTKTGQYDEALALDLPHHGVLAPWLAALHERRQGKDSIWIHSYKQMQSQFLQAVKELGLEVLDLELYAARHGGASHDILLRLRTAADVKRRLRHVSDTSVRHYERSGKVAQALHKMPKATLAFGLDVSKRLAAVLAKQQELLPLSDLK